MHPSPQALYETGLRLFSKRTQNNTRRSIEYFSRALAIDPSYIRAYIGMANSQLILANYGYAESKDALSKARRYASKALDIDSGNAEAHAKKLVPELMKNDPKLFGFLKGRWDNHPHVVRGTERTNSKGSPDAARELLAVEQRMEGYSR